VGPASNVDLMSAAIEAYNRRDLDALSDLMTADVDLRPPVTALTGRAYVGHPGIREWLRDVDDSFASAQIIPIELRDFGARVLALTEFLVEGYESGMELGSELGLVCEIAGGRLATWHGFFNHAEAIAVAAAAR
jgi:hypothetical protein